MNEIELSQSVPLYEKYSLGNQSSEKRGEISLHCDNKECSQKNQVNDDQGYEGQIIQSINLNKNSSQTPYKYLLQHNVKIGSKEKRTEEEVELIKKLVIDNEIFKDLKLLTSAEQEELNKRCDPKIKGSQDSEETIRGIFLMISINLDICSNGKLLWCEVPHIAEVAPDQVFLILEGKTFEYIQNKSSSIRQRVHENNDYVMVRKLVENDYFVGELSNGGQPFKKGEKVAKMANSTFSKRSEGKILQCNEEKYQLMVDQNTLLLKVSDEVFAKYFRSRIFELMKSTVLFLKKVKIFENLPDQVFRELSRFVKIKSVCLNTSIIDRSVKTREIFFIKEGEVELTLYEQVEADDSFHGRSVQKSEDTGFQMQIEAEKQVLGEFDVFGMDTLHTGFSNQTKDINRKNDSAAYSVWSLTNCEFLVIDKRILAVVISSFENYFKSAQKNVKINSVNINAQISGQNYQSREQQMLSRNAQRIKSSENRVRDLRLKGMIKNSKKREINTFIPEKDRVADGPSSYKNRQRCSGDLPQHPRNDTEGHSNGSKLKSSAGFRMRKSMFEKSFSREANWGDRKVQAVSYSLSPDRKSQQINKMTLPLPTTNSVAFEEQKRQTIFSMINSLDCSNNNMMTSSWSSQLFNNQSRRNLTNSLYSTLKEQKSGQEKLGGQSTNAYSMTNRAKSTGESDGFVPKILKKSTSLTDSEFRSGKTQSEMIKTYLNRKLRKEVIKKTEAVLEKKLNLKVAEVKSLKRKLNCSPSKPHNMQQQQFRSSNSIKDVSKSKVISTDEVTSELFQRMTNIKEYPLLCQIETQRKKLENLSKNANKRALQSKRNSHKSPKTNKILINSQKITVLANETISKNDDNILTSQENQL